MCSYVPIVFEFTNLFENLPASNQRSCCSGTIITPVSQVSFKRCSLNNQGIGNCYIFQFTI